MKLISLTGDGNYDGSKPNVGDVLQPGQSHEFSIVWYLFSNQTNVATYAPVYSYGIGQERIVAHMRVNSGGWGARESYGEVTGPHAFDITPHATQATPGPGNKQPDPPFNWGNGTLTITGPTA